MLGGIIGCPAPVAASSPTVACLRSSKKVHSPSRKSLANFLPVLRMSSRPATDLSKLSGRLTSGEAVSATSLVRSEFVEALVRSVGRSFLWTVEVESASVLLRAVLIDKLSFLGGKTCLGGGLYSSLAGDNSDSVLVCRLPENTVLLLLSLPFINVFLLSSSACIQALPPSPSSPSSCLSLAGRAVCNGCSFVTLRASFRFLFASCCAHCRFNLVRSTSAR